MVVSFGADSVGMLLTSTMPGWSSAKTASYEVVYGRRLAAGDWPAAMGGTAAAEESAEEDGGNEGGGDEAGGAAGFGAASRSSRVTPPAAARSLRGPSAVAAVASATWSARHSLQAEQAPSHATPNGTFACPPSHRHLRVQTSSCFRHQRRQTEGGGGGAGDCGDADTAVSVPG